MRVVLRSLLLISLLIPCGSAASFDQIFVFGDSLSDPGNVAIATGGAFPGPNYWNNRFTNGPTTTPATNGPVGLWVDQLATKLGVPDPQPFLGGGTSYAFASAKTGSNGLFNLTDQVNYFTASYLGLAPTNALYAIWGGANDLFFGGNAPLQAANLLADNIRTLSAQGAQTFLWMNLPPLGVTPLGAGSGQSDLLNAASVAFNQQWALDIQALRAQGINVIGVDVFSLFGQIATNPGAYGFTNLNTPAQGLAGVDPNAYLFWDQEHPTTAGHALVANAAYSSLLVATPEPATWAVMSVGLMALVVVSRVRGLRLSGVPRAGK